MRVFENYKWTEYEDITNERGEFERATTVGNPYFNMSWRK